MSEHELERELIWQPDGHLHEVAITALADGESALVPESARVHAATCDACSERVGQAAALSLALDGALETERDAHAAQHAAAEPRRPFPVAAIAAALLLAALGMLPRLWQLGRLVMELPSLAMHARPVVLQTIATLARSVALHGAPVVFFAWCASAVTLVALGALVARWSSRELKGEL